MLSVSSADPPVRPDDTQALADLVHTPTWKWVVDVYRNRGVSVDVVDEHLTVLAPPRAGSRSSTDPIVIEAVGHLADALNSGHGDTTSVGGRRFCCMPFVASGTLAGAALVGGDRERLREDELQRAAALLSRVLEDCLSTASGPHVTSRRLAALHDLLDNARSTGSDAAVFHAFAEIMSVWEDAEIVGYRGDLAGQFVFEAALPGTDRSKLPPLIDVDALPPGQVVNLTASAQRQLGFDDGRFAVLVRVASAGGPWLLAASHRPGTRQLPDWFDFYLAALTESLDASLEVEVAQITWTIMQHLVEHDSPRQALADAIRSVANALDADSRFTMWDEDGSVAFSLGEPLTASSGDLQRADVMRVRLESAGGTYARLQMQPEPPKQFTVHDVKVFEAATWTLARWFATTADQLASPGVRATAPQSFDGVVERCVRARKRAGESALILVMLDAGEATDLAYEWIRRLRSQLRPTDLAGRLTTGEIAVVALDANAPGALVLARRIARVLNESDDARHRRVRVGLAAVRPSASAHSLIAEARQHVVDA